MKAASRAVERALLRRQALNCLCTAGVVAAGTFIPIAMPTLGLLSLMFALFLYTMQLPRIMQQQTVVAIFGH